MFGKCETDEEKQEKIRMLEEGIPAPSWTTDIENFTWHPPVPYPDDYMIPETDIVNYTWNENTQSWDRFSDDSLS